MPFVSKEHREPNHQPCNVGDLCFREYQIIKGDWDRNRRWTTAHHLFRHIFNLDDVTAARYLAFMVLFCKEVMKYEEEKCKENGDV